MSKGGYRDGKKRWKEETERRSERERDRRIGVVRVDDARGWR